MTPVDWALRPLKKYAQFSGRAPRAEFWWFFLALMIVYFIVWFAFGSVVGGVASSQTAPSANMIGAFGAAGIAMVIFWLVLLIPTLAVQVRRLHDTGRSGWWLLGFYILYGGYMAVLMNMVFKTAAIASAGGDASQIGTGSVAGVGILGLAMMAYGIALLVFYCLPGTKGQNKYGADPYGSDVEQVFA